MVGCVCVSRTVCDYTGWGFRDVFFLLTTSLAFENTHSQGTDEVGAHRYCFTSENKCG